jgi:hypothetical protein
VILEITDCSGFVPAHKPAVASNVGSKNGSEPAFKRGFFIHNYVLWWYLFRHRLPVLIQCERFKAANCSMYS